MSPRRRAPTDTLDLSNREYRGSAFELYKKPGGFQPFNNYGEVPVNRWSVTAHILSDTGSFLSETGSFLSETAAYYPRPVEYYKGPVEYY